MKDNKGNSWKEDDYKGYGEFGGKNYYELLTEMNAEGPNTQSISPNIVTDVDCGWRDVEAKRHEGHGYFRLSDSDTSEDSGDDDEDEVNDMVIQMRRDVKQARLE